MAGWDSADVECPRCGQRVRPYHDNGTWKGRKNSHLPGWRLPEHRNGDNQCSGSFMLRRSDWSAST